MKVFNLAVTPGIRSSEIKPPLKILNNIERQEYKTRFISFYKNNSRRLWLYLLKMCGEKNMAEDIFQETFTRFLNRCPRLDKECEQRAFLYKIAYNLLIDRIRRSKREMEKLADLAVENSPAPEPELMLDMEKIFQLLKPREKNLLWLAYVDGYSHREIARITGKQERGIRVQLFRIRKKFAAILAEHGYSGGIP
jgi:RNA polymerase sigma-70 factor (ECF subfamily)